MVCTRRCAGTRRSRLTHHPRHPLTVRPARLVSPSLSSAVIRGARRCHQRRARADPPASASSAAARAAACAACARRRTRTCDLNDSHSHFTSKVSGGRRRTGSGSPVRLPAKYWPPTAECHAQWQRVSPAAATRRTWPAAGPHRAGQHQGTADARSGCTTRQRLATESARSVIVLGPVQRDASGLRNRMGDPVGGIGCRGGGLQAIMSRGFDMPRWEGCSRD